MKLPVRAVFLLLLLFCVAASEGKKDLERLRTDFTYGGKLIHPELIRRFTPWLSDSELPTTISMDVAAAFGSNQFFDGNVLYKPKEAYCEDKEKASYFGYRWLGTLKNGLHVVQTYENSGGTGVFQSLVFLQASLGRGIGSEGKPYSQILLTVKRLYTLGDRTTYTYKIEENRIQLSLTEFNTGKQTHVTLEFMGPERRVELKRH